MKRAVLFDLDGTLLDTLDDLADSMNAALENMGFPSHPVASYRYFVGDGIDMLVRRVLSPSAYTPTVHAQLREAMESEYSQRWRAKSRPYQGISALLNALQERTIPMVVLSNKPEPFTVKAVEHLLSDWHFAVVRGARPNVPTKPDPTSALQIAAEMNILPEDFLYLGDTNTDMRTARAAGMYALGATWGFRPGAELLESGAQRLLKTPGQLLDQL